VRSRDLVVIGGGGHGKVAVSAALAAGFRVTAVLDDDRALWGSEILGIEVSGPVTGETAGAALGLLAIGSNRVREALARRLSLEWAVVVHPTAWVHGTVRIGEGTVVFAGAAVQPDTVIGRHAIVNTGATVDHDCRIGDFAHIAPGASLAGGVEVGEGAFVGIGSSAIPGVRIGRWTTVGAGAAVVRDLPDGVVAAGVPARVLREGGRR